MEYVTLNNGLKMPMVGFGVFRVPDKKECEESVYQAIKVGYRLIDTAAAYYNEDAVGAAVKRAIADGLCTREDLFITSKLWVQDMMDYESAQKGIEASLEKSGLEYFDLYLLHQACGDYFSAWRAMETAYQEGKLKAIGVSNFYPNILTNFCEVVKVKPVVNQVELHPYYTQEKALETMKYYEVIPEAWAPLGGGRYNPFEDEMLKGIAAKYNKSVGQVILRWNVQRGVVVIPKSTHVERIKKNIDIFDFELNEEKKSIKAVCKTACFGKTGVEMEALSGVSIALLTIYDMCKALDRAMEITDIHLLEKAGGKSGHFKRK